MNSSRYFWSSFFSVYLLINLILLINCVTSKKAYARDEKFGKSGGLNPMIKQKYCNLDNYLLDEQNHQIFECIFKPTNVVSTFFTIYIVNYVVHFYGLSCQLTVLSQFIWV